MKNNKQDQHADSIWYKGVEYVPKKTKEDVIYVPDKIGFACYANRLGMKFDNDRVMFYSNAEAGLCVVRWTGEIIVKCILTPCKREDLKVGDWAYATNLESPDDFDVIEHYVLITGDNEIRFVNDASFILKEGDWHAKYWWKVEPIN